MIHKELHILYMYKQNCYTEECLRNRSEHEQYHTMHIHGIETIYKLITKTAEETQVPSTTAFESRPFADLHV